MGRGRKGKKQCVREDLGSGEEEKLPARRRGRPQKSLKDEIEEEEEVEKVEEDEYDFENTKSSVIDKDIKNQAAETGRKRKRSSQVKEIADSVKTENCVGTKTNSNDLIKSVGFRPNGSRRKNKPRRAAAVGVECR